jgi:hypothetical protein
MPSPRQAELVWKSRRHRSLAVWRRLVSIRPQGMRATRAGIKTNFANPTTYDPGILTGGQMWQRMEPHPDGPDILQFQRNLLPDQFSLVPGSLARWTMSRRFHDGLPSVVVRRYGKRIPRSASMKRRQRARSSLGRHPYGSWRNSADVMRSVLKWRKALRSSHHPARRRTVSA